MLRFMAVFWKICQYTHKYLTNKYWQYGLHPDQNCDRKLTWNKKVAHVCCLVVVVLRLQLEDFEYRGWADIDLPSTLDWSNDQ